MQVKSISIEDSLSKSYLKQTVSRDDINKLKFQLPILLDHIGNIDESEENHKIHVMNFLQNVWYNQSEYLVTTKGKIDAVIHDGPRSKSPIGMMIETKHRSENYDMFSANNVYSKSLYQLVLYYVRERSLKSDEIKNLIITNGDEFHIFKESDFDKFFWQKKNFANKIVRLDKDSKKRNTTIYSVIENYIKNIDTEIKVTTFHLEPYFSKCQIKDEDEDLINLYKILSPTHLLRKPGRSDTNELDEMFYSELLYILGLEEVVLDAKSNVTNKKGKTIIRRATGEQRQAGSLMENILHISSRDNRLAYASNYVDYGDYISDRDESIALELCITWINRILFVKLLESQLLDYHGHEQKYNSVYRFLSSDKLADYDSINMLFFDVMNTPNEKRLEHTQDFERIPYLNSSLFQITDLERKTLQISELRNNVELSLIKGSVLYEDAKVKSDKLEKLNSLEYLLRFLDSFNFANEGKAKIQEKNKKLINASVLGLIFEKINGYKDGSFYTPGFITELMCDVTIKKSVVEKFKSNDNYFEGFDGDNFNELKNYITSISYKTNYYHEAVNIIDTLKICDPAVGSGHFLVSALNCMVGIKSDLSLLRDGNENIVNVSVIVEDDELVVIDKFGQVFEYHVHDLENGKQSISDYDQLVQRTLFSEKKRIIENSLFGVDINPNSVNICKLRLWIELLKHSYYKTDGLLETLPNIDINIKQGNSLISRVSIDERIGKVLNSAGIKLNDYKNTVSKFYEATNKSDKQPYLNAVKKIKKTYRTFLADQSRLAKDLRKAESEFYLLYESENLFSDDSSISRMSKADKAVYKKRKLKIDELREKAESLKNNKIYSGAFEWRFEFPYLLDNAGNFKGFDVVIANPPYIDSETMVKEGLSDEREYYKENYKATEGNWDIYIPFMERSIDLVSSNGSLAFITPDKWLSKGFGSKFREDVLPVISEIVVVGRDVFKSALVDAILTFVDKGETDKLCIRKLTNSEVDNNVVLKSRINSPYRYDMYFSSYTQLLLDLEDEFPTCLNQLASCENACATSDAYLLKPLLFNKEFDNESFKVINTGTSDKITSRWGVKEMTYLKDKYIYPRVNCDDFMSEFGKSYIRRTRSPKLIIKGLTKLDASIDLEGEYIPGKSTLVVCSVDPEILKFLCGIINSKFAIFYISQKYSASTYNTGVNFTKDMINDLPVPSEIDSTLISLVDLYLEDNDLQSRAEILDKIDVRVYELYKLSKNVISIIEYKNAHNN
jgi:hypothetical protein